MRLPPDLHIIQHEHHPVIHPINPYNRSMKQELYTCHVINSFKNCFTKAFRGVLFQKVFLKTLATPTRFFMEVEYEFPKGISSSKDFMFSLQVLLHRCGSGGKKSSNHQISTSNISGRKSFSQPRSTSLHLHPFLFFLSRFFFFFTKVGW